MDKSHRLHICYSRIIIGMTTTMLLLLLTLIFMSKLIVKEKIGEESVDTIICVTIVLSTFIGTTITVLSNNNINIMLIQLASLALIMVVISLMIDGRYQNIIQNSAATGIGSVASYILCNKRIKKTGIRKRAIR